MVAATAPATQGDIRVKRDIPESMDERQAESYLKFNPKS
jgi:hypothetical protein